MISKGYTLWLVPTGKEYPRFSELIRKLAKEYGGPVFTPHVTLLGEIILPEAEVIKRIEQLVLNQKPFIVTLEEINYEDYFFRTLFVKAKKTDALLALNNRTKEIFQIHGTDSYMPHLSLLYGNYPLEVKEKIIKQIGKNQSSQFEIKSVHLIKGGEVDKWVNIAEFPFKFS